MGDGAADGAAAATAVAEATAMATAAPTAMATAAPTATATTAMTPAQRGGGDTDSDTGGGEYAAVDGCDGETLRAILARLAREREARCSAEDRARRYAGAAQRACEARDAPQCTDGVGTGGGGGTGDDINSDTDSDADDGGALEREQRARRAAEMREVVLRQQRKEKRMAGALRGRCTSAG